MGDLATKYGFVGPHPKLSGAGETLKVIDAQEGFEFEILPSDSLGNSAIWVAQRIQDDEVSVTANIFVVREINLEDSFSFLGTPESTMIEYA